MGIRRIKLVVEYDGTDFAGFQAQAKGERTVQSVLEEAVERVNGERATIIGAGRTDSGVHARGQVIHFDATGRIPTERIAEAMNSSMPRDIAVRTATEVESGFHARFSATERTYIYLVWREPVRSALWGRFTTWVPMPLDLGAMDEAATLLLGPRNFGAFANAGGDPGSTLVRDLMRLDIRPLGRTSLLAFRVTANGFLRSMVRNLVGTLLLVGQSDLSPQDVIEIAATGDRRSNPCATAPAQGLCLLGVKYDNEVRRCRGASKI